jgi:hypothetical protein
VVLDAAPEDTVTVEEAPLLLETSDVDAPLDTDDPVLVDGAPLVVDRIEEEAPLTVDRNDDDAPLAVDMKEVGAPLVVDRKDEEAPLFVDEASGVEEATALDALPVEPDSDGVDAAVVVDPKAVEEATVDVGTAWELLSMVELAGIAVLLTRGVLIAVELS